MENAIVTEDLCRERRSKFDERCARDIRDIAAQSQRLKTLEEMSITMSQILENMAEKTEQHEQRLKVLEQRRTRVHDPLCFQRSEEIRSAISFEQLLTWRNYAIFI